jgi:hypothetical protein
MAHWKMVATEKNGADPAEVRRRRAATAASGGAGALGAKGFGEVANGDELGSGVGDEEPSPLL